MSLGIKTNEKSDILLFQINISPSTSWLRTMQHAFFPSNLNPFGFIYFGSLFILIILESKQNFYVWTFKLDYA